MMNNVSLRFLVVIVFIVILSACADDTYIPTPVIITATPQPACGIWETSSENITCIINADSLLAQSTSEQVTLRAYEASIVLDGTILIIEDDASLELIVLEGDAVIGARGQSRVVPVGKQVNVPLIDDIADFPSENIGVLTPPDISLDGLPRTIDENALFVTATPQPTTIPTIEPERCPPPPTWRGTYTVSSGDTLAAIANQYDLTVDELADANCLTNVSRIVVGQTLTVPTDIIGQNNSAPIAIGFRADAYSIPASTCTMLRWDAFGVQAIYLDDTRVNEGGSQEICLDDTQSFVLRVVYESDLEEIRELTISVQE